MEYVDMLIFQNMQQSDNCNAKFDFIISCCSCNLPLTLSL